LAQEARNDEEKVYLCRTWVVMMYAHCEKFIKQAAASYVTFVEHNPKDDYRSDVVWLVMKGKENLLKYSASYASIADHNTKNTVASFEEIRTTARDKRSFDYALLRFFCDWILQIAFDHAHYMDFCKRLHDERNAVAHGEESSIDEAVCLDFHVKTIAFMDSLKDAMLDSAISSLQKEQPDSGMKG
jgi:hypothetical protein